MQWNVLIGPQAAAGIAVSDQVPPKSSERHTPRRPTAHRKSGLALVLAILVMNGALPQPTSIGPRRADAGRASPRWRRRPASACRPLYWKPPISFMRIVEVPRRLVAVAADDVCPRGRGDGADRRLPGAVVLRAADVRARPGPLVGAVELGRDQAVDERRPAARLATPKPHTAVVGVQDPPAASGRLRIASPWWSGVDTGAEERGRARRAAHA